MVCRPSTKKKIMDRVRKQYPSYSLKRRKKIVAGIVYRRKK